jgi:uncharacterized membrane protein
LIAAISFFLFLVIFRFLIASGQRGGEKFFSNPILAINGILLAVTGVGSFFMGIVGIEKDKERPVLVVLSTLWGLFALLFVLGEIAFPH